MTGSSRDTAFVTVESEGAHPVKMWTRGVAVEEAALRQLQNIARLPIVHGWVAAMPDVHLGIGATVGSVIPTKGAIIPAAVGVDIGCGMMAVETSLDATHLPDGMRPLRGAIEDAVPLGRAGHGHVPSRQARTWGELAARYAAIVGKHPRAGAKKGPEQLGSLGSGNHFIEVCLDQQDRLWLMLHSGSRGLGNRIGSYFIELARNDMRSHIANLPDRNLAYFAEGTTHFDDYVEAVAFAQDYARLNRALMMDQVVSALAPHLPPFRADLAVVNCHHNYVEQETHLGEEVWLTRKGAIRARVGDMGIIPGSMGTRSYIVAGKGNPESFESASHGAGRSMSRTAARARFSVEDHARATAGIECRKDADVVDETPAAYKPIDAVMAAQADLVEVRHTLRQVVCVKG